MDAKTMLEQLAAPEPPLRIDSHGVVRVGNTRVGLDTVLLYFRQGATAEEIARNFPVLTQEEVYTVIAYYLRNRAIMDAYLTELAQIGDRHRSQWEALPVVRTLRQKILHRSSRKKCEG